MEDKQCVTFYLEKHFFGVDVLKVQEVIRTQEMTPVPLASNLVGGLINLRGQIVTAIDLRRRLKFADRPVDVSPMNVVVRFDKEAVSLLVDEIGDVLEIGSEHFEPPPQTLSTSIRDATDGVYKLQGQILVLLSVEKLLQSNGDG